MPEEVQSFEFKKGVFTYIRYNATGDLEVLYDDQWLSLVQFAKLHGANLKSYEQFKADKRAEK